MGGILKDRIQRTRSFLGECWQAWDWFWFQPQRPEALACLRIFSGAMLLYTTFVWGLELEAFFGPTGFQDPILVQSQLADSTAFSFWWWVPTEHLQLAHTICLGILAMYVCGLFTRLTSILAFVIAISYSNRAINANFGLDQINVFLTCYCAVGASGATFSLDRLWQRFRTGRKSLRTTGEWNPAPVLPSVSTRIATRLVQLHLSFVYLWAGLGKLKGTTWWDGNAIWYALSNGEYKTHELLWIAWHPWISNIVSHVTIMWEITFIALVWVPRLRPWILLIGAGMHLGIGAFMGMWTFGLIMMFAYLMFIPPRFYQKAVAALFNIAPQIVEEPISIHQKKPASTTWAALVKAFDPTNRLTLELSHQGESTDQLVYSMADWWTEVRKSPNITWPFAPTDRLQGDRLRLLVIANQSRETLELQEQIQKAGFECRLASDVIAACSTLSVRPTDAVVMILENPEDQEDYVALRQILLCSGTEGPTSVLVLKQQAPGDRVWQTTEEHRVLPGQFVFEDLIREITASWGEDFAESQKSSQIRRSKPHRRRRSASAK